MSWLGEEVEPAAEGDLAPRCVKDAIEEGLFERRRDLFTDLSLVFMDTTTLSFHGAGGETLGAHGHSKDHRPDLRQMVVAAVLDGEGRPVPSRKPRFSSNPGGVTTTPSAHTAAWDIGRRPRKRSSCQAGRLAPLRSAGRPAWRRNRQCTNIQPGPVDGGRSVDRPRQLAGCR